jgi:dihydropteroate synthase
MSGLVVSSGVDHLVLEGRRCSLQIDRPYIVGILNVTPDSFSDGGQFLSLEKALEQGHRLAADGADLIDVGGESTRPGAPTVSTDEELARVIPVIEALSRELVLPLSVDTSKSEVAAAAVDAGADFVNDVSGLTFDAQMADVVAARNAGLVIMHTRGRPDIMQHDTGYEDVVAEVKASLRESMEKALAAGIPEEKIALDPGIGFGKDIHGNLELLRRTADFVDMGRPVMLGTSRKSFIGHVLNLPEPKERLAGSLSTIVLGYVGGARLFRVHDVAASREAVLMAQAVCKGAEWSGD